MSFPYTEKSGTIGSIREQSSEGLGERSYLCIVIPIRHISVTVIYTIS